MKLQRVKIKFHRSKTFVLLGYCTLELLVINPKLILNLLKSTNTYLGKPKSRAANNNNKALQNKYPICNDTNINHINENSNYTNNNNKNNKTTNNQNDVTIKNDDSKDSDSIEECSWQAIIH